MVNNMPSMKFRLPI